MIRKNEKYTVTIENVDSQGKGIGRIDGFVVFVPGALPGERVEVLIIKVTASYAVGKMLALLSGAPERVTPPCVYFDKCGGCALQHIDYGAQLRYKTTQVRDCLIRIGGIAEPDVADCVGMSEPYRYRNKAQFPVGNDGALKIGLFSEHSHRLVDIGDCLIQGSFNAEILSTARLFMLKYDIPAYDEARKAGLIRHIITKQAMATGQIMVIVVINGQTLPHETELADALMRLNPDIKSVYLNINTLDSNIIVGPQVRLIKGEARIQDITSAITHFISPLSFQQVNPQQTEKLYACALDYAALSGHETVFDAYCGTGVLSLLLAQKAKFVYGVEIIQSAVDMAKENARLNHIGNIEFQTGACEAVYPALIKKGVVPDVIVLDPPRKGCDETLLETLAAARPKRIVYVSCNPATLARDVKRLTGLGYAFIKAQPYDMFPQTAHVETVALMTRMKEQI